MASVEEEIVPAKGRALAVAPGGAVRSGVRAPRRSAL